MWSTYNKLQIVLLKNRIQNIKEEGSVDLYLLWLRAPSETAGGEKQGF